METPIELEVRALSNHTLASDLIRSKIHELGLATQYTDWARRIYLGTSLATRFILKFAPDFLEYFYELHGWEYPDYWAEPDVGNPGWNLCESHEFQYTLCKGGKFKLSPNGNEIVFESKRHAENMGTLVAIRGLESLLRLKTGIKQ